MLSLIARVTRARTTREIGARGSPHPAPREGIARGDARRYGAGDRRTLGADFHDAAVRAAAREARRRGRHRQPNPAVRRARRQRRGGSRQRRGPRERGLHRARGGASRRRTREYRATCERRGAFEKERRRRRRRARGSSARTRQHRVRSRHVFARPCLWIDLTNDPAGFDRDSFIGGHGFKRVFIVKCSRVSKARRADRSLCHDLCVTIDLSVGARLPSHFPPRATRPTPRPPHSAQMSPRATRSKASAEETTKPENVDAPAAAAVVEVRAPLDAPPPRSRPFEPPWKRV